MEAIKIVGAKLEILMVKVKLQARLKVAQKENMKARVQSLELDIETLDNVNVLIIELEHELVCSTKAYNSLYFEYLKLKLKYEKLHNEVHPKLNDTKNLSENLKTLKLGNSYFDKRGFTLKS